MLISGCYMPKDLNLNLLKYPSITKVDIILPLSHGMYCNNVQKGGDIMYKAQSIPLGAHVKVMAELSCLLRVGRILIFSSAFHWVSRILWWFLQFCGRYMLCSSSLFFIVISFLDPA